MKKPLIIITGPTASGKTALSVELAKKVGGEIISADSMQVYRHMDIGSAKVTKDEMDGVRHHLIDVYIQALVNDIDFTENDSDTGYREELECLAAEKGASCLHDMLKEVDPESAEAIHENNVKRVIRALEFYKKTGTKISEHNEAERQKESPYNFAYYVLNMDRERLYQRIDLRVDLMMKNGLLAEVEKLKEMGCTRDMVSMQGLGYKEILDALDGTISLDEAVYIIKRDTRHFAKRQLTWFKREKEVTWVDQGNFDFDREKILVWMLEDLRERNIMAVRKKEKSWNL